MALSSAQRVNAERLVLLGWCRAILLQIAHPLIAAGVAEHSSFRAGALAPVWRLRATVRAMLAISFGDPATQQRALDGIRAIHRRVHGRIRATVGPYAAGTPYSAEDPALVLWVHATLLDSTVVAHQHLVRDLTTEERDYCCQESAWAAVALGADPTAVPRSWSDLGRYLETEYASGRITVGPDAHDVARAVLAPGIGRVAWPALWANRLMTLGLLPASVRQQYGYAWTAGQARRFEQVGRVLRTSRRWMPRPVALWSEARRQV